MALMFTELVLASDLPTIQKIQAVSNTEANHTPRTIASLVETANRGDLLVVRIADEIIGWGIRENLTENLKEVGLMFIQPKYRSAAAFNLLARALSETPEALVLASYDPALIRHSVVEYGFREVSLITVILRSRGKFLTKRINSASRRAVAAHVQKAKPRFALRESLK